MMTDTKLYSEFIHKSRYARWLEEEKRRETWEETVARYIDFFVGRFPDYEKEIRELTPYILKHKVMPSMRCLMTAGRALEKDEISGFNCSYIAIDHPKAFDEILYVLMCGVGVGYSVERQYVSKLPEVAEEFYNSESVIVVPDSKIGWATSFRELLSLLYSGKVPKWDLSRLRPAGARLKTFGGRSSGPDPLDELFNFTVSIFKNAAGRRLNSIECHDLVCKVADIVVCGGVRRSALLSLSNVSDDRMRAAKSGQWWNTAPHRQLANNSACYTERPELSVFLKEWQALYESKSGERGIFSRYAAKEKIEKIGRRDPEHDWGCNPCCFSYDTKLLTDEGYKPIGSLAGKDVRIVNHNGSTTRGRVWSSGVKPVVEIRFWANHDPIVCTPDHVFMLTDGTSCKAENLAGFRIRPFYKLKTEFAKDDILAGFIQGDGSLSRLGSDNHRGLEVAAIFNKTADSVWYSREAKDLAVAWNLDAAVLPERVLPYELTDDFLTGLFSANGCVIKKRRVAFKTTCTELAHQLLAALEDRYGIQSYITTNKATEVKFSNGSYTCKESYDVNISGYNSIVKFAENISFVQQYKQKDLEELVLEKAPKVRSVKYVGEEEVFDFTEPDTHWGVVEGLVAHNSEILLRSAQVCNLSEAVIRPKDTLKDLKDKVRVAAILGTLQSSLTNFRYLRKIWQRNTEEERLLGVSLTGIMDHTVMSCEEDPSKTARWLESLKKVAIETNKEWADKLGIPESAAISTGKPSGTVSQLVNSASGIHARFSPYYIRRVRADKKDPLCRFMIEAGFPGEQDKMNKSAWVFEFPIRSPEASKTVDDMPALKQLAVWKVYQDHWCEHKPSCTVYYTDDDFMSVGAWVWENFSDVSGVSFLPKLDHVYVQAPYEAISEEVYKSLVSKMPSSISWDELAKYESEDNTTSSKELQCSGGACEVVDLV